VVLRAYTRSDGHRLFVRVVAVGDPFLADGASVELRLYQHATRRVVGRRVIRRLLGDAQEVSFSLERLAEGCCELRATLRDRHGRRMPARVLHDRLPGDASWLGAPDGIDRAVPAPWTPVAVRRERVGWSVSCWGRRHLFDRQHFLKEVTSGGVPLLAAPVRLRALVDGRECRWRAGPLELLHTGKEGALLRRTLTAGPVRFICETQADFDGMIRLDWRLSATREVRVDGLTMEVPIRRELAKYLYRFPGHWGSAENVGALAPRGATMRFQPFIWIGDEERGLAWFTESDRNWFPRDPERVITVRPVGDAMLLRLDIVGDPVTLRPAAPELEMTGFGEAAAHFLKFRALPALQYGFGLQATPVKPVSRDAWDDRIYVLGPGEPGQPVRPGGKRLHISPALLDRLVEKGVRAVILFEHWADAEGYVATPHGRALEKIVRDCHARGLKILLYFSFLISDLAPEYRDFGKDSAVMPKGGYPVYHYPPQPVQSAWRLCLQSHWQDRLVSGIADVMRRYDIDGVYLDGTEYPFGCCNTEHGCGALKADGSVHPTFPIFAVRQAMRRIYNVVRRFKPDAIVNVHNSTCMTIPTLEWATSYWDGEQFGSIERGVDVRQLLPLHAFRAEFMGHQWGVPAEFLCYNRPFTFSEACAFTLLHDVPVRARGVGGELDLQSRLWRVMDEFGRKEAEWLPYWRNAVYAAVSPADAYASLYRHPRNGVLVVLSNLGAKRALVRLRLKTERLGLAGPLAAEDALARRAVPVRRGVISCSLPSFGWKLLHVKGAGVGSRHREAEGR